MPSSPDVVATRPSRFEPLALGTEPAAPTQRTTWSFEAAFPAATAAPEPFVVSDKVGVPPAVLAEARRAARSEGYAAGFASGVAEARDHASAEAEVRQTQAECAQVAARHAVERAVGALRAAGTELAGRTVAGLGELEQVVLDSAYELAEALVGSALRDDAVRGAAALRRVLDLVPAADATVTVSLHPADVATLTEHGDLPEDVRLTADPTLTPGDAIARTGDTTVEARLADGLARVREVLSR